MNAFLTLSRWLFIIPFALLGLQSLMNARALTGSAPLWSVGGVMWLYVTGLVFLAVAAAMAVGRYDKLAAGVLAVLLIIMVSVVDAPLAMAGGERAQWAMSALLKDISLAGGALIYALHQVKDRSTIG